MNLQDLVPPLELCKRIPNGEFTNTALVWLDGYSPLTKTKYTGVSARYILTPRYYTATPAPTLQEILEELKTYKIKKAKNYIIIESQEDDVVSIKPIVDTAMDLWLEIKGVK